MPLEGAYAGMLPLGRSAGDGDRSRIRDPFSAGAWPHAILEEVGRVPEGGEQEVVLRSKSDTPRLTPQRRAVLEALRGSSDHPTAAELLSRVQRRSPGTGAATVYRALSVLVDAGLAEELTIGDGHAARFDGNTERHDHLVCTRCGRVVDIVQPRPDLSGVAGTGFTVTGYDLRVHGTCPDCQGVTAG